MLYWARLRQHTVHVKRSSSFIVKLRNSFLRTSGFPIVLILFLLAVEYGAWRRIVCIGRHFMTWPIWDCTWSTHGMTNTQTHRRVETNEDERTCYYYYYYYYYYTLYLWTTYAAENRREYVAGAFVNWQSRFVHTGCIAVRHRVACCMFLPYTAKHRTAPRRTRCVPCSSSNAIEPSLEDVGCTCYSAKMSSAHETLLLLTECDKVSDEDCIPIVTLS